MTVPRQILLLGLGEVGSVLAGALMAHRSDASENQAELQLRAWDWQFKKFKDTHPTERSEQFKKQFKDTHKKHQFEDTHNKPLKNAAEYPDLQVAESATTAARDCDLVISAVTAEQDLAAAESVLAGLRAGCWFLDLNSVSPGTKQAVSEVVENAGGRYLEAAVLSPIAPLGMASPMLLGGPHAAEFLPIAHALGFSGMRFCSKLIGQAAATKMCRSVVVKGMEALLTEATLAARHYGVETEVLESLQNLLSQESWAGQARYMISRSIEHGVRRAEEMREATRTVAEAGIEPWMSEACVRRQDWASQFGSALKQTDLSDLLDSILGQSAQLMRQPQPNTDMNQARELNSA